MNKKKITFNLIFIVVTAVFLTASIEFGLVEKYIGFSFIPILIAYYLGQWVERKTRSELD